MELFFAILGALLAYDALNRFGKYVKEQGKEKTWDDYRNKGLKAVPPVPLAKNIVHNAEGVCFCPDCEKLRDTLGRFNI